MPDFQFFTVERTGLYRNEHPYARASSGLDTELCVPGTLSVEIPNSDPHIDNVIEWSREMQVWKDGNPLWQGVITDKTYDHETGMWTVECSGLLEYFKHLHVGKAKRTNWLLNGSFENGNLSNWTPVGVTAGVVTAWSALQGTVLQFVDHVVSVNVRYQANLYQGGAGTDTFIKQDVTVPGGSYWTLSAWFHIRTDSTWVGPAVDGRGLYVERINPSTGAVEDVQFFAITDETERGKFQRATVNMWSPPGRTSVFSVRLYATRCTSASGSPPGSIIWDEVQLVRMESLSYSHADIATIANGLVSHAQDTSFGRVNLDIVPGAVATGVFADRFFQYADHENIYDCLMAMHDSGLGDFDIELTWDNTNQKMIKTFRWMLSQGSANKPYVLELDSANGVAKLNSIEHRGSEVKNTVIATGEGDGPDRDEAASSNTSETGGIVLEDVFAVPAGTHHDLILGQAGYQVSQHYKVPRIPEMVLSDQISNIVQMGDTFRTILDIASSWKVDESFRIIHMSYDFESDQYTVQVKPA